ncbi:MAG TPA: DUF6569 family protein [Gemmataceae bacterium]|jgi:hypothetical protein
MKVLVMLVATAGLLGLASAEAWAADEGKEPTRAGDYRISGPYTEGNLTVFLIHGKDAIPDKKYLTLAEALEQKKAVVHETKDVNEVSVENLSADADLYLEAGDIIKGGQQDRVISMDLIVKPKSGKVPLPCFCVEAGRWSQRGSEAAANFASSPGKAAGKEVQLAAQYSRDQSLVWKKVAESQMRLSENVGGSVQAKASPSSLQLSQEDKKLLERIDRYVKELAKSPEKEKDVIGYACAINGKVENFDVYGSSALFAKLWPRLLRASAIEAVAALPKEQKKFDPATAAAVVKMLQDADKGKKKEEKVVNGRVHLVTRKSENNVFFETRDREKASQPVHRSGK